MILDNLYNQAVSIIPTQTGQLFRPSGDTINAVGQPVNGFDAPVPIRGSFQAVPRSLYQAMGLTYQKIYYHIYTSDDIMGILRGGRGDQVEFSGRRYQAETEGGWRVVDGWTGVLMVEVTNDG